MAAPIVARIPAVATNGALTNTILVQDERSTGAQVIGAASFVPDTTQGALGATNFCTLRIRRMRAGASVATIASLNLGTTALTAEVPADFVMGTDVPAALDDVIDVTVVQSGTGGAVPAGTIEIEQG